MPTTGSERGPTAHRPPMDRRRFFRRSLAAGASGLLALLGLKNTAGDARRDGQTSRTAGRFPPNSRELAG